MWFHVLILALVTLQRAIEFVIAHRNTKKIEARGGFEVGSNRHGFVVALQVLWLAGLWYLVLTALPPIGQPWIYAYVVLEATRGWIVAALGSSWTTRLMVVPGEDLPDQGFRSWIRHANDFVVAAELVILPLAFGLVWYALAFGILNVVLLFWRMRSEDKALRPLRGEPAPAEEPPRA
ncbi:isoprenylcysteine carboxylmethyltransferase family protein [Aestuariivirga sp.]|uniref:isoprenylcysteine carboxylmethyltransferase family protein n=1 Tax=Aestuariivirga sp. TaxID=2650926 RepID=UPI0025C525D6|nr:isoprenylcysteine carboxylmethyltransferase family protein [Aestuariivirga sp.]MCA3555092.1 hypothetical protein [Aestuariivirga sp.]